MTPLREGKIHLPDEFYQKSLFVAIQDVGNKVKDSFIVPDRIVMLSPSCMRTIIDKEHFFFKESDIIAVKHDVIRPFGKRALIKRFNHEQVSKGGIIIPDCHDSADQSLEGILLYSGMVNGRLVELPVPCGEKVKIEKWSMNLIEIDINGEYYLSVPIKELQYAFDN